jgi:hypothetical protein
MRVTKERKMGKFSRIEYETDVIKGEFRFNNSKQNLVYILSFVTLLGLSIYTIKPEN